MKKTQSIETVTLEEALELFEFPRSIGEFEGKEMTVAIGRFGPYVKHNNLFFSLQKTDDPLSVTMERAVEIIEEKRQKDKENTIREFKEDVTVKVLKGRFGAYIKIKTKNFKIPKGTDPEKLSLEDCLKISEDPKNAPKKGFKRKKK